MKIKILLMSVFCTSAFAQSETLQETIESKDAGKFIWFDTHLQTGNNFVADCALNVEILEGIIATAEAQGITDGVLSSHPNELNSINLMMGKIYKSGLTYISVSGGLGIGNYIYYEQNGYNNNFFFRTANYERQEQRILTLPIQIKAGIAAKVISLQMKAGVNLNSKVQTFHIGLGLGFGKMF